MKHHTITGGGGVQLHVAETGNPRGRPFLFIHGFSQCWLTWRRQLDSDLADDYRLAALDLRGHGLSDKPRDGYSDTQAWADDVNAVIRTLGLDQPILCGSSYGPLVILDYIRHYGDGEIGGANFVGGVTKLGSDEAASALTEDFLGLVPGFFSADAGESVQAVGSLLRLCFASELAAEDYFLMLGYNVSVPSYVRQGLFSRTLDNDDILPTIKKPVLITQGVEDAIVKTTVIDLQMARIPGVRVSMMENAGHACFWDAAAAYNHSLKEFAGNLQAAA